MSSALLLMLGAFFLAGAIRVPIGFAMIGSGVLYLAVTGKDIGLASEQLLQGLYANFVFLSVPLFIFAANVMNVTTVTDRLFDFCLAVCGRLRGGLAHVNVLTSLIFSGMSGSAIADAAGVGKLMIDMMVKDGRYTPGFAAAITAASAVIGPIFPPSIPMVLYAMVSNTSVGYLFLGGMLPGVLMAALQMLGIAAIAKRRNFPVERTLSVAEYPKVIGRATPVDATIMLLVLVPLLLPAARALGIDLVHFGVVIVVNMMIGLVTPPYGVLLFVISGLTGIKLREIIRESWLWIGLMVAQLFAMTYVPGLVLWIPRLFGYAGR